MASHRLPRQPQGDSFFEQANPNIDSQSDDIYASLQAARASAYSEYLATVSATPNAEATPTDDSNSDNGTLVVMQTSTAYVSPTASKYTATSSLLTATETGAAYLNPSSISNTSASASTSIPSNAGDAVGASQTSPGLTTNEHHNDGLSTGELAAAIVLPILAVTALFLLAFILSRRRAQKTRGRNGSGSSIFLSGLREKWGSLTSSNTSTHQTEMETTRGGPIVTSRENNAYFTGLDTSSHGSGSGREAHSGEYYASPGRTSEGGTTFDIPPPVYTVKPSSCAPVLPILQHINNPSLHLEGFSTPEPIISPPLERQSSARSAVSISSTLYSDTASIHSARAARVSIAGPNVIQPGLLHSSRSGSLGDRDPFGSVNEVTTPVSAGSEESVARSGREVAVVCGPF